MSVLHLCLIYLFGFGHPPSEGTTILRFIPIFEEAPLILSEGAELGKATSIEKFKCYISAVEVMKNGQSVWMEDDSFHLLDAAEPSSLDFALTIPKGIVFDEIKFLVGVDSTTSVSGVFGGDLDPTKGMYWTWNSGYINFKLEGKSPASKAQDGSYAFHIGGYSGAQSTCQVVSVPCESQDLCEVEIDLDAFLSKANVAKRHKIMSASEEAGSLSKVFPKIFHVADAN